MTKEYEKMKRKGILLSIGLFSLTTMVAQNIGLHTDHTSLLFKVSDANELMLVHFGRKITRVPEQPELSLLRKAGYGTDWLAYPVAGGRNYREPALAVVHADGDINTELQYVSHEQQVFEDHTQISFFLKDKKGVEVKLIYAAYGDCDTYTIHSEITNLSEKSITLECAYSSALPLLAPGYRLLHFNGAWAKEMQVVEEPLEYGIKTIESKKGVRTTHTDNPSFMLGLGARPLDEDCGEVIGGALAWSGNFKINFQIDETGVLNILSGINPYLSEIQLKRGETFTTPKMIYTYSAEGMGQASRNLHDWARMVGSYSKGDLCPTLLNSWEGAMFDFDEQVILDMIDDAAEMGLEMFVLDDGWFGDRYPRNSDRMGLGDWVINRAKLPGGLAGIIDHAHARNLKFGLWIEPEMVNRKSRLAEKHPGWIVQAQDRPAPEIRHQCLLDLSNPAVQDYVYGVFDNLLSAYDIDYIKWDANRHVESPGSSWLDKQTHFWVEYVRGLEHVLSRIRAKYPEVMIQSCSSGGGRLEYGALKYFDEVWTSDNTESRSRVFIQYGTNLIYPAFVSGSHVSAVPNKQTSNLTPLKFRFDVACSERMGLELQPKHMKPEEREMAKNIISDYKGYRDVIADGDLYRMESPYETDFSTFMYIQKDKSRAVMFCYCLEYQGLTSFHQVRLKGLDPAKTYVIKEVNTGGVDQKSIITASGDYLMNKGIPVDIFRIYTSVVYLIEELNDNHVNLEFYQ